MQDTAYLGSWPAPCLTGWVLEENFQDLPRDRVVGMESVASLGVESRGMAGEPVAADGEGMTDGECVRRVLGGDPEPFATLVFRHSPRLFAMVRRYLRSDRDVADVVQEILIRAHSKLGSYRGDAPFEHWLARVAVRTCYDFLRSRRRHRELALSDLDDAGRAVVEAWCGNGGNGGIGGGIQAGMDGGGAGGDSEARARMEVVHSVLERLEPAHRLVLTLLELEDRTVREVADLTGWSVPMVKVRAFRARQKMRVILERLGFHGGRGA